jgi:predicted porin
MKKTLIALAALAATASFAQSTATISGNLDFANVTVGGTQAASKGSTITTTFGTSSTSVLRFIAVEDLGGGMKATAQYNFDPRSLANDSLGVTNNVGTATTQLAATATGLARDELFVGLSGGFGNIRLGSPNSIGLNAWQPSSSLGTGIGSGYTGGGRAGTMTNSFVQTRYNRSVRYDSPVMGGFQVAVLYAAGNDQPAQAASTAAAGTMTAQQIPNNRQATEIGLRYAAGPLTLAYANVAQGAQTNATGFYSSATLLNAAKTSANVYSASYTMGATTLHAGMNDGDRLAQTSATNGAAVKSKGSNVGITHNIGAIGLMAGMRSQKVGTVEGKVTGLRADYNFSKTAAAYVGYEKYDNGAASANETTATSIGLRKSF